MRRSARNTTAVECVSPPERANKAAVSAQDCPRFLTGAAAEGCEELLGQLKERIRSAQLRASVAVNREMVVLYWQIGRDILTRQEREGWGAKVIDRLVADLRRAYPEMTGLSSRNLKYMRAFGEAWPEEAIVQAPLAQITWYHNIALLEKLSTQPKRLWYARAAIEHGWSRNVLVHWIESDLYERHGKARTYFEKTLPPPQSDLARETMTSSSIPMTSRPSASSCARQRTRSLPSMLCETWSSRSVCRATSRNSSNRCRRPYATACRVRKHWKRS